jgi:glycyl-tRNA synthetase beta chain
MGKDLLLEVGTEEIPAAFLPEAEKDMQVIIQKELNGQRIRYGEVKTMTTPRRLCLHVSDVSEKQEDQLIEKLGPARRVAFDDQGNPTKALIGFARGQGVDVTQLETVTTEKGEYLCCKKKITGGDTETLLPEICIRFITSIPFKKSMRWSDLNLRFARPIHWILALYGGRTIPFKLENIDSGNTSRGHRFMSPEPFVVENLTDYLKKTKEHFVIASSEERRAIILTQAKKAAKNAGGQVLFNEGLLASVTYLTEYPSVVCGSFDETYLSLPKEVLITSMMTHQKYFPLIDDGGSLLPHFVTVNNTLARDPSLVTKGNEKVIRARLADARFFFDEDRKMPLEQRVKDLQNVVFHSLLGTSYEKVVRFRHLAAHIVKIIDPSLAERVDRVAILAKADLDTQMVGEFPDLQGIMGREYALCDGEDPIIARAVYEHYLPVAAGGELPDTDEGAIVSIADKMDTIVGFFCVNLIPTGTADPYALRRQALGIINIILVKQYPLKIEDLVRASLRSLEDKRKRPADDILEDVLEFFRGRFENQLISQGYSYDVVDAVLAGDEFDVLKLLRKIEAMEAFRHQDSYSPVASAFKRIGNIIKNFQNGSLDPGLFETDEERHLYHDYLAVKDQVFSHVSRGDYPAALVALVGLKKPVDAFFDTVLVMAENEKVRFNRLSLLEAISILFRHIADFSKIQTEA